MSQNRYDNNEAYLPAVHGELLPPATHGEISHTEVQLIGEGHQLANSALSGRSGLSRAQQQDTAITHSVGHLIASVPVILALLAITTGLVLIGRLLLGGSWVIWIGAELLLAGAGSVLALNRSRRASLEHTPAGVERHEIDARVEVAKYAIDRHCAMVERLKGVRE